MLVPQARGELSEQLFASLRDGATVPVGLDPTDVEDLQIALWALYELHYRGFDDVEPSREWDPRLLAVRAGLEADLESWLRAECEELTSGVDPAADVVEALEHLVQHDPGPSLATHLHRRADLEQFREYLALRSVYHLKETDPHVWLLPRIDGPAKVALTEIVYDEFGDGRPEASHPQLYADALVGAGLDPTYGRYVDEAPAHVLAVNNAMSFFGLHRRLRGACAGHLAAFEMTSSLPCRRIVQGAQRLGMPASVQRYFDEHVEADAVHEHVASRGLCGSLVAAEPELLPDVLFGAAACLVLDGQSAAELLATWEGGRSGLRLNPLDPAA